MFLYRENEDDRENVTLDIQKHRNGPVGEINLFFKADRTKFYGMEKAKAKSKEDVKAAADS